MLASENLGNMVAITGPAAGGCQARTMWFGLAVQRGCHFSRFSPAMAFCQFTH